MIKASGYWNIAVNKMHSVHFNDKPLSDALISFIKENKFSKVYDFGCGNGFYVSQYTLNGIDAQGFDGNPNTSKIANCKVQDLTTPDFQCDPVDYLQCFEVAEHVPKKFEKDLINTIDRHINKGGVLVLSWAIVGQSGLGHVNCQNNDYVIILFNGLGYTYLEDLTTQFRKSSKLPWFKNTLMVFKKNLNE